MFSAHKFMGGVLFQYMIWVFYTEQFRKKSADFQVNLENVLFVLQRKFTHFLDRNFTRALYHAKGQNGSPSETNSEKSTECFQSREKGGESKEQKFLHFQTFTMQLVNTGMIINFSAYPIP